MIFSENGQVINEGKLLDKFINSKFGKPIRNKINKTNDTIKKEIAQKNEKINKELDDGRLVISGITQDESDEMEKYFKSTYSKLYSAAQRITKQINNEYKFWLNLIKIYKFEEQEDENIKFPFTGDIKYHDVYKDQKNYRSYKDWFDDTTKNCIWKSGFGYSLIALIDTDKIDDEYSDQKQEGLYKQSYIMKVRLREELFKECKKYKYIALDTGYDMCDNYIYIALNIPEFINDLRK